MEQTFVLNVCDVVRQFLMIGAFWLLGTHGVHADNAVLRAGREDVFSKKQPPKVGQRMRMSNERDAWKSHRTPAESPRRMPAPPPRPDKPLGVRNHRSPKVKFRRG